MTIEHDNKTDIKNGPNYDIWRLPLLNIEDFRVLSPDQRLKYLLNFGVMAGSTHNTQPEAFSLGPEGNSISVFLDKNRVLPASDVKGRQACISVGWTIANIAIAAQCYRFEPEIILVNVNPEDVKPNQSADGNIRYLEVARIKLKEDSSITSNIHNLRILQTRRVNRRTYDTKKIVPPPILEHIKNTAGSGVSLFIIPRGDPRITILAELQSQADGYVANSKKFAGELADWLIPNDTTSPYGMPGDTFNLDGQTTIEIREGLADLSKRNAVDMGGFSRSSKKGIESAAFVGMLTCETDSPFSWVTAGIKLGNIANVLEREGLTIAIHAGLAEVGFVRSGLAAMSLTREKPVVLFRAGYPKSGEELPPHSPRANINSFIIT